MSTVDDPRLAPDFQPSFFPRCDGLPAPDPATDDLIGQKMLEYAAAYYRLNICYERLRLTRLGQSEESPEAILEDIDRAVHARDALEDRLAPEGFYAEPLLSGLVTVDLVFSHALKRQATPKPQPASSFSLFVPIPEPGVDLESHLRRHLAPLFGLSPEEAARPTPPAKPPRTKQAAGKTPAAAPRITGKKTAAKSPRRGKK